MSERRMNSWRIGVHFWPVRVRKNMVSSHSLVVKLIDSGQHQEHGS